MRVLTFHQPRATLVAELVKWIETRTRAAPEHLIGATIAVHAGKTIARINEAFASWASLPEGSYEATRSIENPRRFPPDGQICDPLPRGAIVATATLADSIPITFGHGELNRHRARIADYPHDGPLAHQQGGLWITGMTATTRGTPTRVEDQRPHGDFTPGRWAWLLTDVVTLETPVPFTGGQGWAREWEPANA